MATLRVGVIGIGVIATTKHIPALVKRDDVEIVALCDIEKEKAEKANKEFKLGAKIYTDYKELCADENIDVVHVCTPNPLHCPITLDALNHGNCTMGEVSSKIALSAVNLFPDIYEAHIKKKKCDICFSAETIYVDPKLCSGCGECMDVCPLDCIEGRPKYIHMIDDMTCNKCGKCIEVCEEQAIVKTGGKVPKLPNRLTKVGRFKKH